MTRKDYELIASRIKDAMTVQGDDGYAVIPAMEGLALCLAEDFKNDNPNFRPERFLAACGVNLINFFTPQVEGTTFLAHYGVA